MQDTKKYDDHVVMIVVKTSLCRSTIESSVKAANAIGGLRVVIFGECLAIHTLIGCWYIRKTFTVCYWSRSSDVVAVIHNVFVTARADAHSPLAAFYALCLKNWQRTPLPRPDCRRLALDVIDYPHPILLVVRPIREAVGVVLVVSVLPVNINFTPRTISAEHGIPSMHAVIIGNTVMWAVGFTLEVPAKDGTARRRARRSNRHMHKGSKRKD